MVFGGLLVDDVMDIRESSWKVAVALGTFGKLFYTATEFERGRAC
jgi:hypothetical protein